MAILKPVLTLGVLILAFSVAHCQYRSINGGTRLKHISTSVNYIWGVTTDDRIFRCNRPCNGAWTQIPGRLAQVDVGDEEVWGVNSAHAIYKRPADGSGSSWTRIPGGLKHVSASGNGYIWGVNRNDQIFKCKKPCSGSWVGVSGALKQIDGGHDYVYGVNAQNHIYVRPVDGSGGWRHIPGGLKHITASGRTEVFGVNAQNKVFRCKKPCVGEWELMEGSLKQCDATFDSLVGVNTDNYIFERHTGI